MSDDVAGLRRLSAVAGFFALVPEHVSDYFTEYDGNLRLEINTVKLGSTRADQVRAIALLLVVSRQIGHYDVGLTEGSVVRDECDRHGVLDTNFSATISRLRSILVMAKSGHRLTFQLSQPGQTRAKSLMAAIVEA